MKLPAIARWAASHGGNDGISDYLGAEVGSNGAAAVARFLWPTFVAVRDCILLADGYDAANFAEWEATLGEPRRIEAVINHVHLWDVLEEAAEPAALTFIGTVASHTWSAAAQAAFPERTFHADFSEEPDEYGPTISIVTTDTPSR